jgi:hypothetical protein
MPSDQVAGGMLQNLGARMPIASWNLADPAQRSSTLDEIERAIHEVALPYFALFSDVAALSERLGAGTIPSFWPRNAIEWLLSHDQRETALRHGRVLLANEGFRERYERSLVRSRAAFEWEQLAMSIQDWDALAYTALVYSLEF